MGWQITFSKPFYMITKVKPLYKGRASGGGGGGGEKPLILVESSLAAFRGYFCRCRSFCSIHVGCCWESGECIIDSLCREVPLVL